MSDQLIRALRAAVERAMEQRKLLRRASVLVRLWPEGLVIACDGALEAIGRDSEKQRRYVDCKERIQTIPWDELPSLDEEKARAAVDRACAPVHRLLAAGEA